MAILPHKYTCTSLGESDQMRVMNIHAGGHGLHLLVCDQPTDFPPSKPVLAGFLHVSLWPFKIVLVMFGLVQSAVDFL